jgi:hypothetical protein
VAYPLRIKSMSPFLPLLALRALRFGGELLRERVRDWLARRSLLQLAVITVTLLWLAGVVCRQAGDVGDARTMFMIAARATELLLVVWVLKLILRGRS